MSQDFFTLCFNNKFAEAKELYENGSIDINFANSGGSTALITSAANGHLELVKWLIEAGASLTSRDAGKQTALLLAASRGHLEVVKYLIQAGASLTDVDSSNRTALARAAIDGHVTIMEALLDAGANANAVDNFGQTPLFIAMSKPFHSNSSQEAAAKLLIERGADIHATDKNGRNVLVFSLMNQYYAIARLLFDKGAEVDFSKFNKETLLKVAQHSRNEDAVKLLEEIEKRGVTEKQKEEIIPPAPAANQQAESQETTTQQETVEKQSNPIQKTETEAVTKTAEPTASVSTPASAPSPSPSPTQAPTSTDTAIDSSLLQKYPTLLAAVDTKKPNIDVIRHYIEKGADVNQLYYNFHNRLSLLSIAISYGNEEVAKILIDNGADVNERFKKLDEDFKQNVADLITTDDFDPNRGFHSADMLFEKITKAFEAAGRDMNQELRPQDTAYETDYMVQAINLQRTNIIKLMMEAGFDITDVPVEHGSVFEKSYYLDKLTQTYNFYRKTEELLELTSLFSLEDEKYDVNSMKNLLSNRVSNMPRDYYASIIEKCEDINEQDSKGQTILHYALSNYRNTFTGQSQAEDPATNSHDLWVDAILDRDDIDVNITDYEDRTPLYFACKNATDRIVRRMLTIGADPTALHGKNNEPLTLTVCKERKLDILQTFGEFGVDVNDHAADSNGFSLLHFACLTQDKEMVKLLLEHGANTSAADKNGDTPLHTLLREGLQQIKKPANEPSRPKSWRAGHVVEIIDMLLAHNAELEAVNYQLQTPFFVCCAIGRNTPDGTNIPLLKHLASLGAAVDVQDKRGDTCMHEAVQGDKAAVVKFLLEQGADPNIKNSQGESPYSLALKANRRAIVSMIEKMGASIHMDGDDLDASFMRACRSGSRGVAEMLVKSGNIDVTYVDDYGRSPLHYVAGKGMTALAKFLIEHGVSVNYTDNYGQTALHFAAGSLQKEVFKLLIDSGADISISDNNGILPIHLVTNRGQHDLLGILISNGADTSTMTDRGESLLHVACYTRSRECVRLLLENNLNPNHLDKRGVAPLLLCVNLNQKELVKMLLEHGSDIFAKDLSGDESIHIATMRGFKDMITLLVENGSKINALNNQGLAPLHLAAYFGFKDIFKFLLDNGADFNIRTGAGKSVMDIAAENNQKELVELIAIIQKRRELGA